MKCMQHHCLFWASNTLRMAVLIVNLEQASIYGGYALPIYIASYHHGDPHRLPPDPTEYL